MARRNVEANPADASRIHGSVDYAFRCIPIGMAQMAGTLIRIILIASYQLLICCKIVKRAYTVYFLCSLHL